jgi:hypothetical protein
MDAKGRKVCGSPRSRDVYITALFGGIQQVFLARGRLRSEGESIDRSGHRFTSQTDRFLGLSSARNPEDFAKAHEDAKFPTRRLAQVNSRSKMDLLSTEPRGRSKAANSAVRAQR